MVVFLRVGRLRTRISIRPGLATVATPCALTLWLAIVTVVAPTQAQSRKRPPSIVVIADGPSETMADEIALFAREATALLASDHPGFELQETPHLVGDFTPASVEPLLARALADPEIDIVVGFGLHVGRLAATHASLPKPVVLPYAVPRLHDLPIKDGRSQIPNLTFVTGLLDLEREMLRFHDVVRVDHVALLVDRYLADGVANLQADLEASVAPLGMRATVVAAEPTAAALLAAIPPDAEAVYLGPFLQLPLSEVPRLIDGVNARKLPSYAAHGREWVKAGALTTLIPANNATRRMRRVALMLQGIAAGEDTASFDTTFHPRSELVINMQTARTIGVWPRFAMLTEAILLNDSADERGPVLSLRAAVERAIANNLQLRAQAAVQAEAGARLDEAWGTLMPSVDAEGTYTWKDPDVANTFSGAERTLSWGLTASQVVYSPVAFAALDVRRAQERASEHALLAAQLDITLQTAIAYLDVLRARNAERINKDNLLQVRANLNVAETRAEIGSGGREEVHRWQIAIADRRAEVIQASANRNQAEIALSRLLNRELEAPFQVSDPTDPETGILIDPRLQDLVADPWTFRQLRTFLAEESLRYAPELKQITETVRAQENVVSGKRMRLLLPDVVVSAGFTNPLHRAGAGTQPGPGQPEPDDFTWQLGVGASMNLFDGARYADIDAERAQLTSLEAQRDNTSLAIRQRVRATMHQAGATRARSELAVEAAEAANRNLAIVNDAYARGVASVIQLVDAQNSALQSELAAVNARYDFLSDFLRVQRAVGRFTFTQRRRERDDFFHRLHAFIQQQQARER